MTARPAEMRSPTKIFGRAAGNCNFVNRVQAEALCNVNSSCWLLSADSNPKSVLLTIGKKAIRKNFLALTIGLFMHLVFDGAFLDTKMFWWPLAGLSFDGYAIPFVERGLLNIPLEIIGVGLILWTKKQMKASISGV